MDVVSVFGSLAGKVWKALSEGEKTFTQIQKSTGLSVKEVGIGLGWLAREGKISIIGNPDKLYHKFKLNE